MFDWKTGAASVSLSAALLLMALVLGGCLVDQDENVAGTPAASSGTGDTWTTIQRDVLSGCSCHQAAPTGVQAGFRAEDYLEVVNADGKNGQYGDLRSFSIVKRRNPSQSTLYLTVTRAAGMPVMPAVSAADQARIFDWIQAGAPQ
ncbi:MAG: hypothetical protein HY423_07820 [Candidatus Lambdaproteobacteria bacterium]|nr:hypothetical protein [Candidatus Lambdaproteobacteria bacterium]